MNRRNMANKVLAGVFLLFVLASILKHFYKDLLAVQLFSFVTEAAVVGGVADWFAVTALFKKPLGFPWHTALITRHRERVISAVADMVENELLSVHSIRQRVDKICFVDVLIDWIDNNGGKLFLKELFISQTEDILTSVDSKKAAAYLDDCFKRKVRETQLSPYIKVAVKWVVEQKRYEPLVSDILDECINIIQNSDAKSLIYHHLLEIKEQKARSIFEKAVFWLAEQMDSVNLSQATDVIYDELLITLHKARDKDHILYKWIQAKLLEVMDQLEYEVCWTEAIEDWKQGLLIDMDMTRVVEEFVQMALDIVRDPSHSPIRAWLLEQIQTYWIGFTQNQQAQEWVESSMKQAVYKLIENEHQFIGVIVHNVFDTFSNDDLNQFIEEKAGDDLQWIRINGCVVGAFVGLILFSLLHYLYDPFVVPIVQGVFK